MEKISFPKILVDQSSYGDNFKKDCTFTNPEAIISLGKTNRLTKDYTYLEPACGTGFLSQVLVDKGFQVQSSDILDWGYGEVLSIVDYPENFVDVVITNPPFSLWELFLKKSLEIAKKDVYLLLPLRYLEGHRRSLILQDTHISEVLIFTYRVKMYRPDGRKLSGFTAYAWFHWDLERSIKNPNIYWLYR